MACAALRAALRALLRLHCISLLLLVVVMVLLLVEMLLLARRGSATGRDARVRSVACAALRAALRALLRLHCISLLLLVVVMVLLLVEMLLLARRGSATGLDARVASI